MKMKGKKKKTKNEPGELWDQGQVSRVGSGAQPPSDPRASRPRTPLPGAILVG